MVSKLDKAKQKTSNISQSARVKAKNTIDASKSAAKKTIETSKYVSDNAKRKTKEGVDSNPLVAVVGGLALGAIVAALLPKSEREKKILGDAGRKINETAHNAAQAAKSAGKTHMDNVGLDTESLRHQARDIFQKTFETAKSAAKAAQDNIKPKN